MHLLMYASLMALGLLVWHEILSLPFQPARLWQCQSYALTAFLVVSLLTLLRPFLRQMVPASEVSVLRRRWPLALVIGLLLLVVLSQLVCSCVGREYTAMKGSDLTVVAELRASEHAGKGCRYRLEGEIFTSMVAPYLCISRQEFAGFEVGKPVATQLRARSSRLGFYVLSVSAPVSMQ